MLLTEVLAQQERRLVHVRLGGPRDLDRHSRSSSTTGSTKTSAAFVNACRPSSGSAPRLPSASGLTELHHLTYGPKVATSWVSAFVPGYLNELAPTTSTCCTSPPRAQRGQLLQAKAFSTS